MACDSSIIFIGLTTAWAGSSTFVAPAAAPGCSPLAVYNGKASFRNLGSFLEDGGEKEDGVLLKISILPVFLLRLRGSAKPDDDLYSLARLRRTSRGGLKLSVSKGEGGRKDPVARGWNGVLMLGIGAID